MAVAVRATQGALLAGMLLAGIAQAQQVAPVAVPAAAPEPTTASAAPPGANDPPAVPAPAQGDVTTLGEVRALKPEDDVPLDLYRFRSPVKAESNRFSKSWSEPPSPQQVGMSGGYLMMGINYGLGKAAQGLHRLTGGPDQIQSAVARPPPSLTEEQRRRALKYCGGADDCAALPQD
ncbi:hypothetical protein [Stenotrophomonas sp.]|uniref:hypothetical protein n=1 Tax=Stenotrophomonas sp. TaxID=69392 RepID=UPI002FC9F4F7